MENTGKINWKAFVIGIVAITILVVGGIALSGGEGEELKGTFQDAGTKQVKFDDAAVINELVIWIDEAQGLSLNTELIATGITGTKGDVDYFVNADLITTFIEETFGPEELESIETVANDFKFLTEAATKQEIKDILEGVDADQKATFLKGLKVLLSTGIVKIDAESDVADTDTGIDTATMEIEVIGLNLDDSGKEALRQELTDFLTFSNVTATPVDDEIQTLWVAKTILNAYVYNPEDNKSHLGVSGDTYAALIQAFELIGVEKPISNEQIKGNAFLMLTAAAIPTPIFKETFNVTALNESVNPDEVANKYLYKLFSAAFKLSQSGYFEDTKYTDMTEEQKAYANSAIKDLIDGGFVEVTVIAPPVCEESTYNTVLSDGTMCLSGGSMIPCNSNVSGQQSLDGKYVCKGEAWQLITDVCDEKACGEGLACYMQVGDPDPKCATAVGKSCTVDADCDPYSTCEGDEDSKVCTKKTTITAINVNSPAPGQVLKGVENSLYTTIAFTVEGGSVSVTGLHVTRTGTGNIADFEEIRIYKGGELGILAILEPTGDKTEVTLDTPLEMEGGIHKIILGAKMAKGATVGNENQLGIELATDIVVDGELVVKGTFPIKGNAMTITDILSDECLAQIDTIKTGVKTFADEVKNNTTSSEQIKAAAKTLEDVYKSAMMKIMLDQTCEYPYGHNTCQDLVGAAVAYDTVAQKDEEILGILSQALHTKLLCKQPKGTPDVCEATNEYEYYADPELDDPIVGVCVCAEDSEMKLNESKLTFTCEKKPVVTCADAEAALKAAKAEMDKLVSKDSFEDQKTFILAGLTKSNDLECDFDEAPYETYSTKVFKDEKCAVHKTKLDGFKKSIDDLIADKSGVTSPDAALTGLKTDLTTELTAATTLACTFLPGDYEGYKTKTFGVAQPLAKTCAEHGTDMIKWEGDMKAATSATAFDSAKAMLINTISTAKALTGCTVDSKFDVLSASTYVATGGGVSAACASYTADFTSLKTQITTAANQVSADTFIALLKTKIAAATAANCASAVTADIVQLQTYKVPLTACDIKNADVKKIAVMADLAKTESEFAGLKMALLDEITKTEAAGCTVPVEIRLMLSKQFIEPVTTVVETGIITGSMLQGNVMSAGNMYPVAQYPTYGTPQQVAPVTTGSQAAAPAQPQAAGSVQPVYTNGSTQSFAPQGNAGGQTVQPMGISYGVPQAQPGVYGYAQIPARTGPESYIYGLLLLAAIGGYEFYRRRKTAKADR